MNEEIETTGTPEEQAPVEEKQLSPVEQKALELGWRPKEEFDGDEENFIDAKEFVNRQPLFDKIAQQSKQLKALQKATEALQTHLTKVNEAAYKKALADVKAQQEKAVEEGDLNTYHALNQRREEIEEEKQALTMDQSFEEPQVHPELQSWMAQNSWYESQPHMRVFADEVGAKFKHAVASKAMTPQQVLKEIEKAVRAEFPTKFRNPNKDRPSAVADSSSKGSKKEASLSLTPQEKNIMETLVRGGHITKEQYLADLRAIKESK